MAQGKRNDPTIEPTELDKAYAAGFIDADGAVSVRKATSNAGTAQDGGTLYVGIYGKVHVSQVDPRPLVWMRDRWGGHVRPLKRAGRGKARDAWEWVIVGQQAYRMLHHIRPFMQEKGERADNVLRLETMRTTRGPWHPYTDEERSMRDDILATALLLNKRAGGITWTELP